MREIALLTRRGAGSDGNATQSSDASASSAMPATQHPAPPEMVASRAAKQQQRRERQHALIIPWRFADVLSKHLPKEERGVGHRPVSERRRRQHLLGLLRQAAHRGQPKLSSEHVARSGLPNEGPYIDCPPGSASSNGDLLV